MIAFLRLAEKTGKSPHTLARESVNNGKLYKRLTDGGDMETETLEKLEKYFKGFDIEV